MKKNIVILSFLAPFLAMKAQDFSTLQNAFDVYGGSIKTGSAKFNSMAGATGALGGDATSSLVNPAGLGVAISSNVSATISSTNLATTSTLAGGKVEASQGGVNLPNVNAVLSFPASGVSDWKFVNIGINYSSRNLNNTVETGKNDAHVFTQQLSSGTDNAVFAGHIYDRIGKQSEVNIAIAGNYANRLYLGGGINFHNANFDQYDQSRFYLQNDRASTIYNAQYTPYGEVSRGFSANFGAIVKATSQLRLGLALETPTYWNIERVYTYSGLGNSSVVGSQNYTEDRTMTTPMKTTLSAAFVPNKKFAINLDYTVGLSNYHYKVYGEAEKKLNGFLYDNANRFSQVRLGAEYRYHRLRLRGGYAYTGSSLKGFPFTQYDNQGNISKLSTNNVLQGPRKQLGLGIGFDFSSMFIDFGYQYITQTYNNPFFTHEYWANTPRTANTNQYFKDSIYPEANGVSKVKQTFNNVSLTFGWKF